MSYCDIPFTTSNISYNLQLPMGDMARLSNLLTSDLHTHLLTYLLTYLLTLATPRGAFAPKNQRHWIKKNISSSQNSSDFTQNRLISKTYRSIGVN